MIDEEAISDSLNSIVDEARGGNLDAQNHLSQLWDGESWESIVEKLNTEGSVWIVWWYDGLRAQAQHLVTTGQLPLNVRFTLEDLRLLSRITLKTHLVTPEVAKLRGRINDMIENAELFVRKEED